MKKDNLTIDVQFRKFKNGDVLAVFPYEISNRTNVLSYMHVGQHSDCAWDINNSTKAATESEYNDLKIELESIGYKLNVIKRRNHNKFLIAYSVNTLRL